MSKERITFMVAANMSGSDKRKLFVIGKSKKPRCFPKDMKRVPVDWSHSKKAWMTSKIFEKYLRDWDAELGKTKRKILLLVDNCPAHPNVKSLQNIKLVFLPANTTSILQPMGQGVINSLKVKFRKRLIVRLIFKIEKNDSTPVNMLEAVTMVSKAWNDVTKVTIRNCFRHAGLKSAQEDQGAESNSSNDAEQDINAWAQDLDLPQSLRVDDLQEYVAADEHIQVTSAMTDEEILSAVRKDDQK